MTAPADGARDQSCREQARSGRSRLAVVWSLRGGATVCAAITAVLSILALVGWVLGVELFKGLLPGLPPMKANAAVCYLLGSLSLLGYARSAPRSPVRRMAAAGAVVMVVVGAATLAEYAFGWRLGIDQLLFGDRVLARAPYPGRPSANAALGFGLLGVGLVCWEVRVGRCWVTNVLAWVVAALGLLALIGYTSGAQSLIGFTSVQHIALNSAVAVTILALGVLLARSDRGEMALLARSGPGGIVLRRLLPVGVGLLVALAVLTLAGRQLGLLSAALSEWVFAGTVTVVVAGLGWMIAAAVVRGDAQRRRVQGMMRSVAETASDGIVTVSGMGVITYANPALERMFGYQSGAAVGQPAANLLPDFEPAADRRWRSSVRLGGDRDARGGLEELTGVRRDGRAFPVEVSRAGWQADGERVAAAIIRDVSERQNAERRFHGLLESAPDAIIVTNAAGEILLANARAEAVFGYEREELIGSPVERLLPIDKQAAHAALRRGFVATPRPRHGNRPGDFTARRRDGSVLPVEITLNPVETEAGLLVSAAIRDISERTLAERATAQLAAIVASSADAVIGLTPEGTIESWNAAAERIYGYPAAEAVGRSIAMLLPPGQHDQLHRLLARVVDGEALSDAQSESRRRDGRLIEVSMSLSPIRDRHSQVIGASMIARDITAQRQAQAELRHSEERLRTIFEGAPIGVALLDADRPFTVLRANPALAQMLGVDAPEDVVGRPALTLLERPQRAAAEAQLQRLLDRRDRCLSTELQLRADGREPLWVAVNAAVIDPGADARPEHLVLHLQDITDRKHYEHQLRLHAERDPLTGLLNRRAMDEQLQRLAADNDRYGTPVKLMVCDLDNLKLVNDTLGHQAGDQLIIGVARALSERLRDTDVLARMGGDEFAVLLPHTDPDEARTIAERLRAAVLDLDLTAGPQSLHTTLSIGIAPLGHGLSTEESLLAADLAMYEAKRHGRNRVAIARQPATGTDTTTGTTQLGWLGRLRAALAHDRFELHAQPITELRTGQARCLELLLRLREPDGELLMPAAFIPTAERFGLIAEIDRWVVREAIRILAHDQHSTTTYTVNLSGVSVGDPELLDVIQREITTAGVDSGRLIFEFTETAAISDLGAAREFTHGLARLGCRSAIDDFGSGFGAFSYLKHLPVNYLKIDGEFIRNLPGSPDDRVLLKAIIDVARGLRKQTIAEFVSSHEALALLRDYGADYAQGFHLGTPAPLAQTT